MMDATGYAERELPAETAFSDDTALARFILDLRSKGITDARLLDAFERVPRAVFLPGMPAHHLYAALALPLPCGEEATDPFTLARHILMLDIRPGLRVLEIGTGSGFLAAILAHLGVAVTSYERYRTLVRRAEVALRQAGVGSVNLLFGDGLAKLDLPQGFDRIIVNGALEVVPAHLLDRLNGSGIALAHRRRGMDTRLTLWRKDLTGFPAEQDGGPSRMGLMRAGIPETL